MNDDEKFGEFVQREAQSYRAPADVPRDAMWAAIQQQRRDRRASAPTVATAAIPVRAPRYAAWIGFAATLVIGVAIGRYALHAPDSASRGDAAMSSNTPSSTTSGTASSANDLQYGIVAVNHLSKAEALITAYGNTYGASDRKTDAQLGAWARDLLSNTRLLLDSPAGADPARRKLLQDLELVLVQIVQKGPAKDGAHDRADVNRSLERTHVLERLRATQAAGLNSGT
jgi:hypothetical protein